jgi:hypothetical protein
MSTLLQEFTQIVRALNERGIDYAVCGGWAMAIHGYTRATIDIDILILSEDLDRIWRLIQEFGYDIEGLPLSFDNGVVEIRRLSKIDKESKKLFTVDFLLVTDGLRQVWKERCEIQMRDLKISTVSKDGLIFLKTMAGRKQDLADIERLSDES